MYEESRFVTGWMLGFGENKGVKPVKCSPFGGSVYRGFEGLPVSTHKVLRMEEQGSLDVLYYNSFSVYIFQGGQPEQ